MEGKGTADAAYSTGLLTESCRLAKVDYTGGAADIFKCFDQVVRPLVGGLLEAAGMPERARGAYMRFVDDLEVRNTIAGGLGQPYSRKTSIPQGDPLSMMVTALLLRPWIAQMREMGIRPRVLADDLQLVAVGDNHLQDYTQAMDVTHRHLQEMGARVAPKKCISFSSSEVARRWLRDHRWRRLGTTMPVANDGRDLGAHFNVAGRRVGTTQTERLHKAARSAERIAVWKAPYRDKQEVVRAKTLAMGLYGCEMAPINEAAVRGLRTSIANAINFTTSN